jgi:hypothetical protein
MENTAIAEVLDTTNMFELACKTNYNASLTDTEKDVVSKLDAHFREIGKTGHDESHEIAAFITKTINEEINNTPDELLDFLFDRDGIGAYDDYEATILPPKNTLVAYEAAHGGNVERSFLDINELKPAYLNRQIETDLSFTDLKRNGWKSVALVTEYAMQAFRNAMFKDMFDKIDLAIQPGADNCIVVGTAMPTEAAMQQAALYVQDMADGNDGAFVGRTKYIQAISHFASFASQEMLNEVHRTGRLGIYEGISLYPINGAKKLGDGTGLIVDKRIFGIAGKIGTLTMKGDMQTYQIEDPNKEVFHLMFKDFEYGYAFNKNTLDKVVKIELA